MKHKYSTKSVLFILLTIISTLTIDTAWRISLENSARTQAKYNLSQIKMCVNDLLLMDKDGLYTRHSIKSEKEIYKALHTCAGHMKVSNSGSVWAFNLQDKKYIFDSNPKYSCGKDRYWTKKKICKNSREWCHKLVTIMSSGTDSTWMGYSWLFKHDKEYLEWRVLPSEDIGFGGLSKSSVVKPQQIVVVQGVSEKEMMTRYKWFRLVVYGIGFMMIFLNLLLSSSSIMYGRRRDDTE